MIDLHSHLLPAFDDGAADIAESRVALRAFAEQGVDTVVTTPHLTASVTSNPEELEQYLTSYRSEREAGEKLPDAYRVALQGVLTSRHFIHLVEGEPTPRERVTDFELASRLSYFLWSSMPDDELFTVAKGGALNGAALKKDRKSTRLNSSH